MIEIKNLNKTYHLKSGDVEAAKNVSLTIEDGEIYGIIGYSGAGKSTLVRCINLLEVPDSGEINVNGVQLTRMESTPKGEVLRKVSDKELNRARKGIGMIFQHFNLLDRSTVFDNIAYPLKYSGKSKTQIRERVHELLELVGLSDTGKKKAKNFSLGMRQRLGIAIALCGNPDFLVLDEPVNGLDPQGIVRMRELILKLNHEKKITVLISSHILDELSKLATHYGFIDGGRIVEEISAKELNDKCRRCIKVTVSDIRAFSRVMDKLGLTYVVSDDSTAQIYDKISISRLAEALASEKCELIAVSETEESLESHFIKLIGGGQNE